jgi:cysteine sulfinate desulfinase/cysteine desulfurase-like protein
MPLQIDSVGEISIVAKPEAGQSTHRLGSFGQAFVDHLNEFSPRTNLKPGTKLLPGNGRCHMSHIDAQMMVMAHSKTLSSTRL